MRNRLINNYLLIIILLHIMKSKAKEKHTVEEITYHDVCVVEECYQKGREKPRLPWELDEEYDKVEPPYEDD